MTALDQAWKGTQLGGAGRAGVSHPGVGRPHEVVRQWVPSHHVTLGTHSGYTLHHDPTTRHSRLAATTTLNPAVHHTSPLTRAQ